MGSFCEQNPHKEKRCFSTRSKETNPVQVATSGFWRPLRPSQLHVCRADDLVLGCHRFVVPSLNCGSGLVSFSSTRLIKRTKQGRSQAIPQGAINESILIATCIAAVSSLGVVGASGAEKVLGTRAALVNFC
jgi:hypothetical protein